MSETFVLSYADYAVVSTLLIISASIGLYFSVFGGKQNTNNDYLFAGKDMPIFPVSFSLMVSFISVTAFMGIPAEMYLYGTNMAFINIGFAMGPIIASALFLPIYFNAGVSTPFEYLEKRFGSSTRRILSIIFLLQNVLYSGVSLYAPALALSAVTNLSMWVSVTSIAAVGTFYSTLGGMKAVIWTDVYQTILMYTCLFCIIIKGCLDFGGIKNIFKIAYDGERILLPPLELDFSIRYTMWSVVLQGFIFSTSCFVGNNMEVQRQLTLKTLKRSVISSLLSIPMIISFQLICCLCGIVFYVYFRSCDPVTLLSIQTYDQLMPYYIISAMREYPGLPGLCITGIFSVSLSSISAAMNSMAAVTYKDIILPLWPNLKRDVFITKIANFIYGAVSIIVVLIVQTMGNIVQACILIVGMTAGPVLGVFFLAALTTTANEMGVNMGVLSGFLLAGFMTFLPKNRNHHILPIRSDCSGVEQLQQNASISVMTATTDPSDNFPVSFMWISSLSFLLCLVVGYVASLVMSYTRGTSKNVSLELLSPVLQRFWVKNSNIGQDYTQKDIPNNKDFSKDSKLRK